MECCWYGCDRVRESPSFPGKLGLLLSCVAVHACHTCICGLQTLLRGSQLRWARTTHALGLGREYIVPFHEIGSEYHSSICALCA